MCTNGFKSFKTAEEMRNHLNKVVESQAVSEHYIDEMQLKEVGNVPILASSLRKDMGMTASDEDVQKALSETGVILSVPFMGEKTNLPVASTAIKTLCDRAKLYGQTALAHPTVLNEGFPYYKGMAQALVQDGVLLAVHSDEYSFLPQSELFAAIENALPDAKFVSGFYDVEQTASLWELPQYQKELDARGLSDFTAAMLFTTNDVAMCGANVQACLRTKGGSLVRLGYKLSTTHSRKHTVEDFRDTLSELFSIFEKGLDKIEALEGIAISHPEDCFQNVARDFKLPKKDTDEAMEDFTAMRPENATAYDVYIGLSAVCGYAKANGADELKVLDIGENLARVIHIPNWSRYDEPYMR